jgi:uncharacterized protein YuzE
MRHGRDAGRPENTTLDLDRHGNICAITIEHASQRAGAPEFTYEQVSA